MLPSLPFHPPSQHRRPSRPTPRLHHLLSSFQQHPQRRRLFQPSPLPVHPPVTYPRAPTAHPRAPAATHICRARAEQNVRRPKKNTHHVYRLGADGGALGRVVGERPFLGRADLQAQVGRQFDLITAETLARRLTTPPNSGAARRFALRREQVRRPEMSALFRLSPAGLALPVFSFS